ncbi:helix-turn-helix domain containing protein [Rhodobacter sp. Har01]|uniref:helix-turn-helix domain containing protein n=1 Tax=Rhodobacter sp. Har01 TaxID=2883999 RepID=UPI001D060CD0|nr:helix-turn-helix domain containing protein [Rhodobacter sp. Har01]MCB6179564.1 helix-turn-helix domain containing protein [Rhodobacter sp. Har01]
MARSFSGSGGVVHSEPHRVTKRRSIVESAAQVIETSKARFRVKTDTELAARLLIRRSSVANRRNRDSLPDRYRRIADGQGNRAAQAQSYGEMTDVERAAMRIAVMRLVHDFGDVATDCRAFLEKSMAAAAS